ncbi:hypothetical protein [Rubellimicrobium roseum]|uniref:Uncharacterized protein n=1 Tax=Rubellimicrobium roseum TaxID=687525 RepID=A0A5C4NGZ9_9RHOB|nr:hypothetical protein [Rubellimicrobium roseum]TNC74094.1 hypothetical protein FHG71_02530 [Rubellimicrobium roseum]
MWKSDWLAEQTRVVLSMLLALASVSSAYFGIVYWAVNGWLWGVFLSGLVPGFGAVSTWMALSH